MGFSENDDNSKGSTLKAMLCMRGDTEKNIDTTIKSDSKPFTKSQTSISYFI